MNANDWCYSPPKPTRRAHASILFRIRADVTGTSGFSGLWLGVDKRPQIELYRPGTRDFILLPYPESVVSFADDNRAYGGEYYTNPPGSQCTTSDNRQLFTGCCTNPASNAADFAFWYPNTSNTGAYAPASTFTWGDACTRYVAMYKDETQFNLLRLRENTATCGTGEPQYTFEDGGAFNHTLPPGYTNDIYYGGWPDIQPLPGSTNTLLGYRHAKNVDATSPLNGLQGQFSFTVAAQTAYKVSLRTYYSYYVQALNGGGSSVNATATAVGTWETLTILDINGGALNSGEQVYVQASNGNYLTAEGGGGPGSVVNANRTSPGAWETFTIVKMNGSGVISTSDPIALRSSNAYYVVAEGGGGGAVNCDRTSAGGWETFTLAPVN